jgi:hypothetical protein
VTYNVLPTTYNQFDTMILEPGFNSQNSAGSPESNKQYVKYPYYVSGSQGNTYGIPFMDSQVSNVFNTAALRGFFYADLTQDPPIWSALTSSDIAINTNYIIDMTTLTGGTGTTYGVIYDTCNESICRLPQPGDIVTIYFNGVGAGNCSCEIVPTPTPTPSATPSVPCYNCDPCVTPQPTPTPSGTPCLPTPPRVICTPPQPTQCVMSMTNCYPILTYRIISFCNNTIELDRPLPNFDYFLNGCYGRIMIYPSGMTQLYDSTTPRPHWNDDVINFESVCDVDQKDVRIWNMNIPWSENPAGLISSTYIDYTGFGSIEYLGSKEYYGYASDSGQTDSSNVFFYNSFDERQTVLPKDQKAIAIVHYTNYTIDFFYGEKFAMQPHDDTNPVDNTGEGYDVYFGREDFNNKMGEMIQTENEARRIAGLGPMNQAEQNEFATEASGKLIEMRKDATDTYQPVITDDQLNRAKEAIEVAASLQLGLKSVEDETRIPYRGAGGNGGNGGNTNNNKKYDSKTMDEIRSIVASPDWSRLQSYSVGGKYTFKSGPNQTINVYQKNARGEDELVTNTTFYNAGQFFKGFSNPDEWKKYVDYSQSKGKGSKGKFNG